MGKKVSFKKIRLKRIASNPVDIEMLSIISIMVIFGLIMVGSASSVSALYTYGSSMYFLNKQIIVAVAGFLIMLIIANIDYHVIASPMVITAGYALAWLAMMYAGIFGQTINGARRWINIAGISIQPSELTKIVLIVLTAYLCSKQSEKAKETFSGSCGLYLAIIGISAIPLLVERHKSATVIFAIVVFAVAFFGGVRLKYYIISAFVIIPAAIIWFLSDEYSRNRVLSVFNPFLDAQNTGYQAVQSLYAIGSGGVFGMGLGRSQQKIMYIPEPQNDFIFSIICEELGFIGAIAVIGLFIFFMIRGIKIASEAPDKLGKLIAMGLVTLIMVQFVLNIAVVTSTIPVTGMPLPFFSAGGTNLLFTLASMGILLNISKQSVKQKNNKNKER